MTQRLLVIGLVGVLVLGPSSLAARQATGAIAGVVVSMEQTPRPVRRAIVTLSGDVKPSVSAITDDSGRFTFPIVPEGRFTLTASKASYVTNAYGARKPGRPGTVISLAAGQRMADLRLQLPRGSVITGTVRGPDGQPAANVGVSVIPSELAAGRGSVIATAESGVLTDDRGVYRAFGLMPGDYIVMSAFRLLGSGAIAAMSPQDIDSTIRSLQSGARPGRGVAAGVPAPTPPAERAYGYAPTFFPGTPVAAEATRISLGVGEERSGIDITLQPVVAASVEGRVSNLGNVAPTSLQLSMDVQGPPLPISVGLGGPALSLRPGPDGLFRFTGVTPGTYMVTARVVPPSPARGGPPAGSTETLWATAEISVRGSDISGVALDLQPGMRLSGRVAFDASRLTPPSTFDNVRVTLPSATVRPTGIAVVTAAPSFPKMNSDGTFEISGILPGRYNLAATTPGGAGPDGWWLRSAILGSRDLLDGPIEFSDGGSEFQNVVVTFSDRHTELNGALETPASQPATEYYLIVFPTDRTLWVPGSRRVRSTRPGSDGRFTVRDLPPGEYLVVALTDVEPNEWQNPTFLADIAPSGVKVTIAEGGVTAQTLRIAATR